MTEITHIHPTSSILLCYFPGIWTHQNFLFGVVLMFADAAMPSHRYYAYTSLSLSLIFQFFSTKKDCCFGGCLNIKPKLTFLLPCMSFSIQAYNEKYETGFVLLWVCGQERKKKEKTGGLIVIKGPQSHVGLFHLLSYTCGTSGLYTHTQVINITKR